MRYQGIYGLNMKELNFGGLILSSWTLSYGKDSCGSGRMTGEALSKFQRKFPWSRELEATPKNYISTQTRDLTAIGLSRSYST